MILYKMIDLYAILAMTFNSFLVVTLVIYIIEIPNFYFLAMPLTWF